jgi:hypothetical protein
MISGYSYSPAIAAFVFCDRLTFHPSGQCLPRLKQMGMPHSRSDIERYSSKAILIGMGPTCTFADLQPRWPSSRLPVQLECLHFPASASASVSHPQLESCQRIRFLQRGPQA